MQNVPFFKARHNFYKKYFFLSVIVQWNNLDLNVRISRSLNILTKSILKPITPSSNNIFNSYNPKGIKFITRLSFVQSLLPEHKFKHSFQNLLNPISNCGLNIESSSCHLLHYLIYNTERYTLLSTLKNIGKIFLDLTKQVLTKILLFRSSSFDRNTN